MIDPWLLEHLACPKCRTPVVADGDWLRCAQHHQYPVSDGVPIMVLGDVRQTHWAATASLEHYETMARQEVVASDGGVDPVVMEAVGATCGNLYEHLIGSLTRYPIPGLRLSAPVDSVFLDLGCHWGRWCISAARKGWRAVGLDPYYPGIRAAKRVAASLGVQVSFVVGDARYLPFAAGTFDIVHSYSVLQHFSEEDVEQCAAEVRRVLCAGGVSYIQMAQMFGALNLVQQLRRRLRPAKDFEVRYWPHRRLERVFASAIGPTHLVVDGFFSLNAQTADLDLLRPWQRGLVHLSEALRHASSRHSWLVPVADSVHVHSVKSSA